METSLRGYAIAVLQNAEADPAMGGVAGTARDLRQISDVVSATSSLAQVLTDEIVPQAARRSVVTDLLSDRVTPPALRIVQRAIAVEHADGLLSVLVELAELAAHFSELGWLEFEAEEPLFGRIAARKLASGYAAAVFEDVATPDLETIEDELFAFGHVVAANAALRSALSDSSRPVGDRRQLVSNLLNGKVGSATIRLARAALHGRSRDPVGSINWMAERAAEARGWRVARVTSARGLDDSERTDLSNALGALTGGPVELLITQDPELLGGAVISIGNVLVDASAQHRLEQLKEEILGSERIAG